MKKEGVLIIGIVVLLMSLSFVNAGEDDNWFKSFVLKVTGFGVVEEVKGAYGDQCTEDSCGICLYCDDAFLCDYSDGGTSCEFANGEFGICDGEGRCIKCSKNEDCPKNYVCGILIYPGFCVASCENMNCGKRRFCIDGSCYTPKEFCDNKKIKLLIKFGIYPNICKDITEAPGDGIDDETSDGSDETEEDETPDLDEGISESDESVDSDRDGIPDKYDPEPNNPNSFSDFVDSDGDGYPNIIDSEPNDPYIYPGSEETPLDADKFSDDFFDTFEDIYDKMANIIDDIWDYFFGEETKDTDGDGIPDDVPDTSDLFCSMFPWLCDLFDGDGDGTTTTPQPCVPDCDNKECGDGGCGGSCGECSDEETCRDGKCQEIDCTYDESVCTDCEKCVEVSSEISEGVKSLCEDTSVLGGCYEKIKSVCKPKDRGIPCYDPQKGSGCCDGYGSCGDCEKPLYKCVNEGRYNVVYKKEPKEEWKHYETCGECQDCDYPMDKGMESEKELKCSWVPIGTECEGEGDEEGYEQPTVCDINSKGECCKCLQPVKQNYKCLPKENSKNPEFFKRIFNPTILPGFENNELGETPLECVKEGLRKPTLSRTYPSDTEKYPCQLSEEEGERLEKIFKKQIADSYKRKIQGMLDENDNFRNLGDFLHNKKGGWNKDEILRYLEMIENWLISRDYGDADFGDIDSQGKGGPQIEVTDFAIGVTYHYPMEILSLINSASFPSRVKERRDVFDQKNEQIHVKAKELYALLLRIKAENGGTPAQDINFAHGIYENLIPYKTKYVPKDEAAYWMERSNLELVRFDRRDYISGEEKDGAIKGLNNALRYQKKAADTEFGFMQRRRLLNMKANILTLMIDSMDESVKKAHKAVLEQYPYGIKPEPNEYINDYQRRWLSYWLVQGPAPRGFCEWLSGYDVETAISEVEDREKYLKAYTDGFVILRNLLKSGIDLKVYYEMDEKEQIKTLAEISEHEQFGEKCADYLASGKMPDEYGLTDEELEACPKLKNMHCTARGVKSFSDIKNLIEDGGDDKFKFVTGCSKVNNIHDCPYRFFTDKELEDRQFIFNRVSFAPVLDAITMGTIVGGGAGVIVTAGIKGGLMSAAQTAVVFGGGLAVGGIAFEKLVAEPLNKIDPSGSGSSFTGFVLIASGVAMHGVSTYLDPVKGEIYIKPGELKNMVLGRLRGMGAKRMAEGLYELNHNRIRVLEPGKKPPLTAVDMTDVANKLAKCRAGEEGPWRPKPFKCQLCERCLEQPEGYCVQTGYCGGVNKDTLECFRNEFSEFNRIYGNYLRQGKSPAEAMEKASCDVYGNRYNYYEQRVNQLIKNPKSDSYIHQGEVEAITKELGGKGYKISAGELSGDPNKLYIHVEGKGVSKDLIIVNDPADSRLMAELRYSPEYPRYPGAESSVKYCRVRGYESDSISVGAPKFRSAKELENVNFDEQVFVRFEWIGESSWPNPGEIGNLPYLSKRVNPKRGSRISCFTKKQLERVGFFDMKPTQKADYLKQFGIDYELNRDAIFFRVEKGTNIELYQGKHGAYRNIIVEGEYVPAVEVIAIK